MSLCTVMIHLCYLETLVEHSIMSYNPTKQKLESKDIYSVLLFALFRLTKDKDYAILSQMACIIDRDSLVRLCA